MHLPTLDPVSWTIRRSKNFFAELLIWIGYKCTCQHNENGPNPSKRRYQMQNRTTLTEFQITLITGKVISLTRNEASRVFLHPWVLSIYSGLSLFTAIMNQKPWTQDLPFWMRTAIYFVSSVVGLSGAWATIMVLMWAVKKGVIRRVYAIIFDLSGAFLSLITTYVVANKILRPAIISADVGFLLYAYYIFIIAQVSLVIWTVLVPRMLVQMRHSSDSISEKETSVDNHEVPKKLEFISNLDDPNTQIKVVIIGQTRIPATSITHVSAQGNYVNIHTPDQSYFETGTMHNVVAQIPSDLGLQVHRSHWVSYSAIQETSKNERGLTVTLKSGVEVPVSRNNAHRIRELRVQTH